MKRLFIILLAAAAASGQQKKNAPPGPHGGIVIIPDFPRDLSPPPSMAQPAEWVKPLTVMINATIESGETRPGAGIIFALANDQIYIATANHLVRRATAEASDVQVEFKWSPGQPFPAKLLNHYDTSLDLAVIAVPGLAKMGVNPSALPLDRLGNPSALPPGFSADPVWAIGYPNGTAYDVSPGQLSQVEGIVLGYRVAGLVPGGYSGGPLVDRSGLILGMIRQDQPPNAKATRIDLIVSQLRAWGYQVALHSPAGGSSGVNGGQPQPNTSPADVFRATLLRYVDAAPSGFVSLGAANQIGGWQVSPLLPNAISCRGRGPSHDAFVECVLAHEKNEVEAERTFEEIVDAVRAALPSWRNSRMNIANWYFFNGRTNAESTVSIGVSYVRSGGEYDITLGLRPR